jgi:hypothetical protein
LARAEPTRISVNVGNIVQELKNLLARGTIAQCCGILCSEGIYGPELLFEDSTVEEKQGIKRLVLGESLGI